VYQWAKMEIDGVLLTSMSTKELSAHARARGIPPLQSRAAFLNALADALANEEENVGDVHNVETMVTTKTTTRVTYAARGVGVKEGGAKIGGQVNVDVEDDVAEAVDADEENYMDRDDMDDGDAESYFVGSAAFVWEDEVYTYGGLAHEGEFVTNIYRWSGRGACYEVPATATDPEVGLPPGRYGHTAVVHGDLLYVFGGQGQFGCLNDLWVFDFVACSWTLVDVLGDPPPTRTGHCMCISDNVLFVFGGKDVQPGQDVVIYNDLYGFDLADSEWLTIDTQWKHPVGGEGCAMAARNSVLYILSPSETSIEMVLWVLQLSAQGTPRWTMVARAGQVPSPRTSYLSCVLGSNWIIHGGRVLLQDQVLGDTYVFHFPTGEWARLNPDSDTDPRFSHAGACVDGALVILHGSRDPSIRSTPEESGVCIAINLEAYIPFPMGESGRDLDGKKSYIDKPSAEEEAAEEEGNIEGDAITEIVESNLEAKILSQLNERGIYGMKGGLMGGSLHVPIKGSHDPGDMHFIVDNVKIYAHTDVIRSGSKYLSELLDTSPITAAMNRTPDVVRLSKHYHRWLGMPLSLILRVLYYMSVLVLFTVRKVLSPEEDAIKSIVLQDTRVPVLLAALRWIYEIPVHPSPDMLSELYELAKRLKIDGLPSYCVDRLKREVNVELVASTAKVAYLSHNALLWKAAVRVGQQHWKEVSHTAGFLALTRDAPHIAQDFSLSIHESVVLPGRKSFI